jgi:hypothetical protein
MINQNTPDKLAEIIRDTWPNLYRPPADFKPPSEYIPMLHNASSCGIIAECSIITA